MRIITGNDVEAYSKEQLKTEKTAAALEVKEIEPKEQLNNVANNDYLTKLVNYIPVPVVAAFLAIDALIKATTTGISIYFYWLIVVILAAGAAWYIWNDTTKPPSPNAPSYPPSITQTGIAVVSFVIWVYAIGGPFAYYSWYQSIYGAILVILWVFIIPIVVQTAKTKPGVHPSSGT